MSIAGGYHKAIERALAAGCDCAQIFTKNNNQWRAKTISPAEAEQFRIAYGDSQMRGLLSHASYLINLASPQKNLWTKSVEAMQVELLRAEQLGVPDVVVHPGAYTDSTEAEGVAKIAEGINRIHSLSPDCPTRCLLETTAGQGTNLGWRFEQLAEIMDGVDNSQRVGVCLDTCHVFAAGYALAPREAYAETMSELDRIVGLNRLHAIHLNDSKKEFASRRDRHEHIGDGFLGLEPFRLLLNDPRMGEIPMYLETAKGNDPDGRDWDIVNLDRLRALVDDA